MKWIWRIALPILFFALVFGTGQFFPVTSSRTSKAEYQPPGWVFAVAWAYITLTTGLLFSLTIEKNQDWLTKLLPVCLLILWCSWIVNDSLTTEKGSKVQTMTSTSILILSGVFLCVYLSKAYACVGGIAYLLLPGVLWMFIATSLNGYLNNKCVVCKDATQP